MNNAEEDIEIPKENLQKINSIVGKATYNDYHWWNLIGVIKNLMQTHTNQTLNKLKEKVEGRINKIESGVYSFACDASKISELKNVITLIDESINE